MILPARLLYRPTSSVKLPEKILKHVTSILMHILIKFGIKNNRFVYRNNEDVAARLLW